MSNGGFVVKWIRAFGRCLRRYLTVGVGSTLVDWVVLGLLTRYAGWSPVGANLVSRPCGAMFGFTFNKVWTFEHHHLRGTGGEIVRYGCVWLCAYAVSSVLIWVFSHQAGWGALQSKIVAEVTVNSVGFLVLRYWAFRAPSPGVCESRAGNPAA